MITVNLENRAPLSEKAITQVYNYNSFESDKNFFDLLKSNINQNDNFKIEHQSNKIYKNEYNLQETSCSKEEYKTPAEKENFAKSSSFINEEKHLSHNNEIISKEINKETSSINDKNYLTDAEKVKEKNLAESEIDENTEENGVKELISKLQLNKIEDLGKQKQDDSAIEKILDEINGLINILDKSPLVKKNLKISDEQIEKIKNLLSEFESNKNNESINRDNNKLVSEVKNLLDKLFSDMPEKKSLTKGEREITDKLIAFSDKLSKLIKSRNHKSKTSTQKESIAASVSNENVKSDKNISPVNINQLNSNMESSLSNIPNSNSGENSSSKDSFEFNQGQNFSTLKGNSILNRVNTEQVAKSNLFDRQLQNLINKSKINIKDNKNGSFSVKLYPKKLGNVVVNLNMENGIVHGKFLVDSPEARDLLNANLHLIKEQLQESGVSIGDFNINLRNGEENFSQEDKEIHFSHNAEKKELIHASEEFDINRVVYEKNNINLIV